MDRSRSKIALLPAAGIVMVVAGMGALAAIQYRIPTSTRFVGPVDPHGAGEFALWLIGASPAHIGMASFLWSFRALVALVWAGYAMMLYAGFRQGVRRPLATLAVAGALACALALLFPASLSHDLYAYLGFARMGPIHGMNPYAHSLRELAMLGDIAAGHYPAPHTSVYGPVWTLLSSGIASAARVWPIAAQLALLKLVEAGALIGAALAARAIARVWDPAHADLALVAVALNPLLLLEGPGNGHNDLLMIALMLAGIALVLRRPWQLGYVVLGASVGVKYMSLAIIPWLILEQVRGLPWKRALGRAAAAVGLVALPLMATLAPFWTGADTLKGLASMYGLRSSGRTGGAAGIVSVVLLYAVMTAWVWKGRGGRFGPAWTVWSTAGILLAIPGVLPWYLAWPTSTSLTRWDGGQKAVMAGCALLGLSWMLFYTVLRGG